MAASDSEKARAVLKGFFQSQPGKADWPADPEEACIKHASFLKLWWQMALSKPKSREAWKGAFPKMSPGDMNAMISGVAEARKWLGRKQRNLKTGDRTHPIIRDLMKSLEASNGSSPKGQGRRSTSPKATAVRKDRSRKSSRKAACHGGVRFCWQKMKSQRWMWKS